MKEDLEEFELKLEKERDTYASLMFDLMAEEETISNHFMNYVKCQQLYYKEALDDIDEVLKRMNPSLCECLLYCHTIYNKLIFSFSLLQQQIKKYLKFL